MTGKNTAKAGDKISISARRKYAKALRCGLEAVDKKVAKKAEGGGGQWFCITCGTFPENNMQAGTHAMEKPTHKLAWRSFTTGKIEEP